MKKYLIVLCSLLLVGLTACTADNGNKKEETNPFKGTTWVSTENPVTWSYTSNTVFFDLSVGSGIVWNMKGTVTGNTMTLVDSSIQKANFIAIKK